MIKATTAWNWEIVGDELALCSLGICVTDAEKQLGIPFEEYEEDGLGSCYSTFALVDDIHFLFKGFWSRESVDPSVTAYVGGNEENPMACLKALSNVLNVSESSFPWVTEYSGKPEWSLFRQGDDGNEVLVANYHWEDLANGMMKRYEAKGHKQVYFVKLRSSQ